MSHIKSFTIKASLLATAAAFGLQGIAHAQAAEEPAAREDVIVVTGTPNRDSQEAAIDAKRDADNVVDIISADTIGRFPDQNLADSLGRLPGIAIERDQGQARYVNFRGAPFRYTSIAFDGVEVPGAENGRVPRFDSIPSVVTRAVEANKAVTPNMPGESVAGYVNIRTFDPFEYKGFAASLGSRLWRAGARRRPGQQVQWPPVLFGRRLRRDGLWLEQPPRTGHRQPRVQPRHRSGQQPAHRQLARLPQLFRRARGQRLWRPRRIPHGRPPEARLRLDALQRVHRQ
jgi:outer membrane receptor protein involved in Fe transport